jgi:GABA permease
VRHYLVVANQTLGQPRLIEKLQACMAEGPCRFFLLVPATHAHARIRFSPAEAYAIAQHRLDGAVARLQRLGADVHGEVGDPSPIVAIGDVLRHREFDELILSTLPPGPSQWLRRGVPDGIKQLFHRPVTVVVAPGDATASLAPADAAAPIWR